MKKVLLAMSGGLDSSMAAVLLQQQGFDIVGVTMKVGNDMYADWGANEHEINEARKVAHKYNFPHYVIDLHGKFNQFVVNHFVDEYMAGRTPNPCTVCNPIIKWGELLKIADEFGCEKMATGHYAKINESDGRYFITKGEDDWKDQSYFLWGLKQKHLKRTMFPLGNEDKKEIRKFALQNGFENLANKKESYDVCFIKDDYRDFIAEQIPDIGDRVGEGDFFLIDGTYLGKHKGYPFYTIGQRKGLNVAVGHPLYVTQIDVKENKITLGTRDDLLKSELTLRNFNLMKYDKIPDSGLTFSTRVRYKDGGTKGRVLPYKNKLRIEFEKPVSAITPGQSAVFYDGSDLVGGGFIE